MATYEISSPDGQRYRVNAPDDATEDQVMAYAQKSFKMAAAPERQSSAFGTPGDLVAGLVRGAGSIGATLLSPLDYAAKKMGVQNGFIGRDDRRSQMDAGLQSLGADTNSWAYSGGKLGGEIAGTAGAGGLVARGLGAIPGVVKAMPSVIDAIGSMGMSAAGKTGLAGFGARTLGGGVSGGAMGAMVDPEHTTPAAATGAAMPAVLKLAGMVGGATYNAFKAGKSGAGRMLAETLGVSEAELPAIVKALESAPESIVPGSKLTVSQALSQQGVDAPNIKLMEHVLAGGKGGDALFKRYSEQGAARLGALESQGAQVYPGAAAHEADSVGNTIGAILRTQADDKAAANAARWGNPEDLSGIGKGVYPQAVRDKIALQLPIDEMQKSMVAVGRGSTLAAPDAHRTLAMAREIGTMEIPAIKQAVLGKTQSLEQAVRSMGGIKPTGDYLTGELAALSNKQSGTSGLVSKMGKDIDRVTAAMHERGFIPENDPAVLLEMLVGGRGRNVFARDINESTSFQRSVESAMGDLPAAERIPIAAPFSEFQRLWRDSGSASRKLNEKAGNETEAAILNKFQGMMGGRVDDAAAGNLKTGEVMTPEFAKQYFAARDATKQWHQDYDSANNISQILHQQKGGYSLGGDQITNKVWHGGAGLVDHVNNLKNVLSPENYQPTMDALRKYVMTDAASNKTAAGNLSAGFPAYVENRMPGLLEVLNPEQYKAVTAVAADIRNAADASTVTGLLGSPTHSRMSRAMGAGLLESPGVTGLSKALSYKGFGLDTVRSKVSDIVQVYKGKTLSDLMADPKAAAQALSDSGFVKRTSSEALKNLREAVSLAAPVVNQRLLAETQ